MPSVINTQTNQIEEIAQDSLPHALRSGFYNLPKGQPVHVIDPNGVLGTLPSEQVPEALTTGGYTFATQAHITEHENQQKYGEGFGPAKAAAAGLASGATFGLSDMALTKTGLVDPETLAGLEKYNPTISGISNVVGAVAPIIATAGMAAPTVAAAELGAGVTRAVVPAAAKLAGAAVSAETSPIVAKILAGASKTGAKALGSAVEAAAYGAGQSIHESALGDPDALSENLMHNIGYAAILGGGLNAGLGLTGAAYKGTKSALFGIREAALKDATIAGAEQEALNLHTPPTSLAEMQERTAMANDLGFDTTLDAKRRLVEVNNILAEDSKYPAHAIQLQSLDSPYASKSYQALLSTDEEAGKILGAWQRAQKQDDMQLANKYIKEIHPNATEDISTGGKKAVESFEKQHAAEQAELKPLFKQIDAIQSTVLDNPQGLVSRIDEAIPNSAEYLSVTPDGIQLAKFDPAKSMPKETYLAMKDLVSTLNKPDVTLGNIRNIREAMRDRINMLSSPRDVAQIGGLRKSLMDFLEDEIQRTVPDLEVRDTFKRYAINEQNKAFLERDVFKGKLGEKGGLGKGISHEDVLPRFFKDSDTVRAARQVVGDEKFNEITADYLSSLMKQATDPTKGFYSNRFASLMKTKAPELTEALVQHPDQYEKLKAAVDKMRILGDAPPGNPSGTAITKNILEKMQGIAAYLNPKTVLGEIGKKAQSRIQLQQIEDQLAGREAQYHAFAKIERMAQKTANSINRGAKAIFDFADKAKGPIAQKLIPDAEKHEDTAYQIKYMVNNLEEFTNKMGEGSQAFNKMAPSINQSTTMAMSRATNFLASKLPAQEPASPLTEAYKPSKNEIAKFNRYYQVVEDPTVALQQVKDGTLAPETIEALTVVHPKTYMQMKEAVIGQLSKQKSPVPYQTKLMLSMFTGNDFDNSLKNTNIIANQAILEANGPQQPKPPQTNPQMGALNQSNQALTPLQKTEARGSKQGT